MFEAATRLETLAAGREYLTGEAARRYIHALVRSRAPENLDLAHAILEFTGRHTASSTTEKRESNEIISILTTTAMLERATGATRNAEATLRRAFDHKFVTNGECPYLSRMELELEAVRLSLTTGGAKKELRQRLVELISNLEQTRHFSLAMDAQVLLVEASEGDVRSQLLRKVEMAADTSCWRLRLADLEVLRRDPFESAVETFAC